MERTTIGAPRGTLLLDPSNPTHAKLRQLLPDWRAVAIGEVVGLDVLDGARLCVLDWRFFDLMPHLRELLMRRRGATVVLVGLSGERVDTDGLVALRRFAGEVVSVVEAADPAWTSRLLVPVTSVGVDGIVRAVEEAVSRKSEDLGHIDVHLGEAQRYVQRSDDQGAFIAAARALALAPDQPGIVADVARLLARMGRSAEGQTLCKSFLLQRPDSEPVQKALNDLHPAVS